MRKSEVLGGKKATGGHDWPLNDYMEVLASISFSNELRGEKQAYFLNPGDLRLFFCEDA